MIFYSHVSVGCPHFVQFLVIIVGGVKLVGGGTDSILASVFKGIVVDGLNQFAHQLFGIEGNSHNVGLNNSSTVLVHHNVGNLLVLGVAILLSVRLTTDQLLLAIIHLRVQTKF